MYKKENNMFAYVYSHKLYRYLNKHSDKVYSTPFLKKYNNFVKVFGEPRSVTELKDTIIINYFQQVYGDPCETCSHFGLNYYFDPKTKELIKK